MNNREAYYRMKEIHGIEIETPEERIRRLVAWLIDALYMVDKEEVYKMDPERVRLAGIEHEPINWGALGVSDIYEEDGIFTVIIDEASPDNCPNLCEYVRSHMEAWGWSVDVITEW